RPGAAGRSAGPRGRLPPARGRGVVSPRRVAAVAERIALGFRRDRRSLALLLVAPLVVLSLVGAVWGSSTQTTPAVAIAADRMNVPALAGSRITDGLRRSSAIKAHTA